MGRKLKFGVPTKILTIRVPEKDYKVLKKKFEKIVNEQKEIAILNHEFDLITQYKDMMSEVMHLMNKEILKEYSKASQAVGLEIMDTLYKFLGRELYENQNIIDIEFK